MAMRSRTCLTFVAVLVAAGCNMLTGASDVAFLEPEEDDEDERDASVARPMPSDDGGRETPDVVAPPSDAGLQDVEVEAGYNGPLRVFVTNQTWTGNLGGLTGADILCAQAAAAANLGGSGRWAAWLSSVSDGVSAVNRLTVDGPWELVNGEMLAASKADLTDGNVMRAPRRTETNVAIGADNDRVWTGTRPDGTPAPNDCARWTSGAGNTGGNVGEANFANGNWTNSDVESCNNVNRLYCFELR